MAHIRPAELRDLEKVEYICRMTAGDLACTDEIIGKAVSKTFSTYYICECCDTCFILADENDDAVGYILCETDYKRYRKIFRQKYVPIIRDIHKKDGRDAWFLPIPFSLFGKKYPAHLHIDILPEYQNKGFGSKLIEALLIKLKAQGVKGVMLTANFKNSGAIRFYKRLGFKTVVSSKALNGIIMAKNLSE